MKKVGLNFIFALPLLFLAVLFCIKVTYAQSVTQNLLISEIAWMGTASSSYAEWLEIFNPTDLDVVVDGWFLVSRDGQPNIKLKGVAKAHDYFLLERSGDNTLPSVIADQIYTGSLDNGGEYLELINDSSTTIDFIDASTGWPGGSNSTKVTLERLPDLSWATSSISGGTPKATNTVTVIIEVLTTATMTTPVVIAPANQLPVNTTPMPMPVVSMARPGEVMLNEFVSDPLDGQEEWVELYSAVDREISLGGWTIEDGSKTRTSLSGNLKTSSRFVVVDSPKGALNNTGDLIILRDASGQVIDQLTYGDYAGGQFNAGAPRDGQSLARRFDGVTTYNSQNDWSKTETTTKGEPNLITTELGGGIDLKVNYKDLVISEIYPAPLVDKRDGEFVEFYNQGTVPMSLAGWRLTTKSGSTHRFASSTIISPGGFRALFRKETFLALTDDSGSLKLYPPDSNTASQNISYKNGKTGSSYIRDGAGVWQWTLTPTPGLPNKLVDVNQPPDVSFYVKSPVQIGETIFFDSSDTSDPENDVLQYFWQFGDGATSSLVNPEHSYGKSGNFRVKLQVGDGKNNKESEEFVKVVKNIITDPTLVNSGSAVKVVINELLPNPEGNDEDGEWVEVKNLDTKPVSLFGWQLDDVEGGSSPFMIADDVIIEPGKFYLFERSETGVALNNTTDEVRLFNASSQIVDRVSYQKTKEGMSWSRLANGKFDWSLKATPNAENILVAESRVVKVKNSKKSAVVKKEVEEGNNVLISCIVSSLPGSLASQYFSCQNDRGWQIYNYKKNFPELSIGDLIEVSGVVQRSNNNWRLKIVDKQSIKVVGKKELKPINLQADSLSDSVSGRLVIFEGEITKKIGSSFYLDDSTGEVLVYLKSTSGLRTADYSEGERLTISGIIVASQSGLKLLPRSKLDIVPAIKREVYGQVATSSGEWLASGKRSDGYIVVGGSLLAFVGLVLVLRRVGVKL